MEASFLDPITIAVVASSVAALVKALYDLFKSRETNERVLQAEKEAFTERPKELEARLELLAHSQEGLELRAQEVAKLLEESRNAIAMGSLFNLYNKQIERYQQQTRSRASWSFVFAIMAMFAGLGFVFWGGSFILQETGWDHVVAGSAIAAIGGSISAYITKTFLDVHQLSLKQLNRYFRQPVVNDHVLMAQRLANELGDGESRTKAYELIIGSIAGLIKFESASFESPKHLSTNGLQLESESAA